MRIRRATSPAVALLVAAAALGGTAPASLAATDQLRDTAVTTYELQPARGVVHVTIVMTLTNKAPSTTKSHSCTQYYFDPYVGFVPYTTTCTTRTDYYYNWHSFWIERDAKSLKAKADSGSATIKAGRKDGNWQKVTITYKPLYYGKTRKLTFSYDLPAGGPRSTAKRRVGYAYATFCATGPGTDSGSMRVVVPDGFEMLLTSAMTSTTGGGKRTYSTGTIKEPWRFDSCFTGSNREGYAVAPITASDGRTISVEAWREDKAWAAAVQAAARDDLPAIAKFLGPIGGPTNLTIRERVASGSATAEYDSDQGLLHLSESVATRAAATRELTRLWFPANLFSATWIREGYAAWAEHEAGVSDAPCSKPGPYPGGGGPSISSWIVAPTGSTLETLERAAYQGQAACYIMSSIAAAIGPERMLATVGMLRDRIDPFAPGAPPGNASRPRFWHAWVDAVEQGGLIPAGADPTLAMTFLTDYGVNNDDTLAAAHARAIAAYRELVGLIDGPVPSVVAEPLAEWKFDVAEAAIETASAAWKTAQSVDAVLPGVSAVAGPIERAVNGATSQDELGAAKAQAELQLALATDVAGAIAAEQAPRDLVQQLGLAGATLPDNAIAVDAVRRIDAATARTTADQIRATIGTARDLGIQRLAMIVGSIVALLLLVGLGVGLRRRGRRRRAALLAIANATPNREPDPPDDA